MKRKSKDYYREISEHEKRSAEIKKEVDRELSAEDRKVNMINRIKKIRENE